MGELILLSGRDPLRTAGGTESYAIGHAAAARLAGYAPHLFALGPRTETFETDFATYHRLRTPVRPVRGISSPLQRPWLLPAVVRFLRDRPGPHVIHAYGAWGALGARAAAALGRRGVEAVPVTTFFTTIEHETAAKLDSSVVAASAWLRLAYRAELAFGRAVAAPAERRALQASRVAIVNYDSVRRIVEGAYGRGAPVRHLPYAAGTAFSPDDGAAEPTGLPPGDAPLIVSTSRHDGRKGLDVLIRALAGLRDGGVGFRACLCGTGILLEEHRRFAASLGLGERVTFPGRVPEVMPYLRACDVFVLPSLEEGSGAVSVLEALQAGRAIVASNVDGLPEDLTDGADALLAAPGDVAALRDALARLVGDAELRERLGAAARTTYEERFSPRVVADALRELYEGVGLAP